MYKTSAYTLVNGNIKELGRRKQQKSQKVILFSSTLTHSQCDAGTISPWCFVHLLVDVGDRRLNVSERDAEQTRPQNIAFRRRVRRHIRRWMALFLCVTSAINIPIGLARSVSNFGPSPSGARVAAI